MSKNLRIIKRPLVTEKVTRLQEELNQYCFEVSLDSNKIEIKRAVEERFKVSVTQVRTSRVNGKLKRLGRFAGKRPSWKKAIVTLAEGDKIELFEGA